MTLTEDQNKLIKFFLGIEEIFLGVQFKHMTSGEIMHTNSKLRNLTHSTFTAENDIEFMFKYNWYEGGLILYNETPQALKIYLDFIKLIHSDINLINTHKLNGLIEFMDLKVSNK